MSESGSIFERLAGSGDPVEGNPFGADNPRHSLWREATRVAELEVSQMNAAHVSNALEHENEYFDGTRDRIAAWAENIIAKFDIWARRYLVVVLDDEDLKNFRSWLARFAKAHYEACTKIQLTELDSLRFLPLVRVRLVERVELWKSRGSEKLRGQSWDDTSLKRHRRALVRAARGDASTDTFARRVGKSKTQIYGFINGDATRYAEASLREFLAAAKIPPEEWNRDRSTDLDG